MRTLIEICVAGLLTTSAVTHAEEQTVTVGRWTIATSYKGDKFDNCSMSRSTAELDITLVRAPDGLLLLLDSRKWKLERGKAHNVRLVAGSRTVEAKALAEFKGVTIALEDRALRERLRTADLLDVRGEGATLRVPLDGSTAALGRLEACFEKNSRAGVESNPFIAPSGTNQTLGTLASATEHRTEWALPPKSSVGFSPLVVSHSRQLGCAANGSSNSPLSCHR